MSQLDDDTGSLPANKPKNANRRWTESEEAELRQYFERGTSLADLAVVHGRSQHAIRLRLVKLGLVDGLDQTVAPEKPAAQPMTPRVKQSKESKKNTKLTIELVPQSCWFSNVRSEVSPQEWEKIRRPLCQRANYRCEVCGGSGGEGTKRSVECHEIWHYDDARLVQTLVRMVVLCPPCHEVKHIGRATLHDRRDQAEAHLAKVNGWSAKVARRYVDEAFAVWETRSAKPWTLDISVLADYGVNPPTNHDRKVLTLPAPKVETEVTPQPAAAEAKRSAFERRQPTLEDVVSHLACGGRQPRLPLLARSFDPMSPLRWLTSTAFTRGRDLKRPPQQLRHTPFRMVAAPPAEKKGARWEREGNWWFWWDGRRWTGDRKPAAYSPGWWQDPYGPGLRWWTGSRWSQESLRMKEGWIPVSPGNRRLYLWWDGMKFVEQMRPIANGTRVRPKDRKNVGKVIGIDQGAREQPALVYFRNKRTGRDATVNFSFSKLQRT